MKRLLFACMITTGLSASAQSVDSYILKVETGKAYTPVTGGTNLTASLVWDEENFKFPMPWTADIGGKSTSNYSIMTSTLAAPCSDTIGTLNAFVPFGADLTDRAPSTTPVSPIRYLVSGTSPNRIFKLEFFNAGFFSELMNYGTLDDSVNFQVWLYETSNIVEFRYGSSYINHAGDYFVGAAPFVGYAKNIDFSVDAVEKLYLLSGAVSTPNVDSFTSLSASLSSLNAYPASGTVYRFIPKSVAAGIGEVDITGGFKVYPTMVSRTLNIEATERASAQIMNVSGQNVGLPQALNSGKNEINLDYLPSGNYLLRVNTGSGSAVYRFQKQ